MALVRCTAPVTQGGYRLNVGDVVDSTHVLYVKYPSSFAALGEAFTYPASGNMFDAVAADLLINVRTDTLANAVSDIVTNLKSLADNVNQSVAT